MNKKGLSAVTLVSAVIVVLFLIFIFNSIQSGLLPTFDRAIDFLDFSERSRSGGGREVIVMDQRDAMDVFSGFRNQLTNVVESDENFCFGVIDIFHKSFFDNDFSISLKEENSVTRLELYSGENVIQRHEFNDLKPCVVYGEQEAKSLYDEIRDYNRGLYPSNIDFSRVESLSFEEWESLLLDDSEKINYRYSHNYFLYILKNQDNICFIPVTGRRVVNAHVTACRDPARTMPIIRDIIRPGCLDTDFDDVVTLKKRMIEHDAFCDDNSRNLAGYNIFMYSARGDNSIAVWGFSDYAPPQTRLVIPREIDGRTVVALAQDAFKRKNLESVEFPDTIDTIPSGAFSENKLSKVEFGDSIKSIGIHAFSMNELSEVKFGNNIEEIRDFAFRSNNLTRVEFPESLELIGEKAFDDNNLNEVIFRGDVSRILEDAFRGNGEVIFIGPPNSNVASYADNYGYISFDELN